MSYSNVRCLIIHLYQLKGSRCSRVRREGWPVVLYMIQVQSATLWMACQVTLCRYMLKMSCMNEALIQLFYVEKCMW